MGERPSVDVAIIGGGIVGAACAAFIAAGGATVRLYERAEVAAGASGRNSGVVQHPFDPILVGLYRETLELYRELAARTAGRFRLPDVASGLLLVGVGSRAATATADLAAAWSTAYPDTQAEALGHDELVRIEPTLGDDVVACRLEIGFPVAPASATRAYAELAASLGATIATDELVTLATDGDRAIGVRLANGDVEEAGRVVVAAGPWTPDLFRAAEFATGIERAWGLVAEIDLEAPPHHVLEEIEIDIEPRDDERGDPGSDHGIAFSLATAGGVTGLGSTFLPFEPPAADYLPPLVERGAAFVPAIATAAVRGTRVCARPVSADRRPLVGRVPGLDGAFVAAGHGPWGISTGPATARMIADLVLDRDASIPAALDAARVIRPPRTTG
jgi:glycine/D-amino acid oxidase-like deaminating enzyme